MNTMIRTCLPEDVDVAGRMLTALYDGRSNRPDMGELVDRMCEFFLVAEVQGVVERQFRFS